MITRRVRIQLAVFAVFAVVGLVFAGGRYAGLGKLVPGYDPGYLVKADFRDSGGIFEGAQVTYRGVSVGTVEKLTLISDGVQVGMRIKPGTKIPSGNIKAFVGNRSAIGEQYVDLQPCTFPKDASDAELTSCRTGPLLGKNSVIGLADTDIPIQPATLVRHLDQLVTSVDTKDVSTVLDQLGVAFTGAGDDLQRLIDASDDLTTTATQYLPQTQQLIADSKPVLDTARKTSGDFKSYNADLAQLTTQLRSSDPDFRKLFATGTDSARAATSLLEANRQNLPLLLDNLVFVSQVQAVRIPAIRQIIVTYPNVVAGGFTVTPGDGTAHFGFVTANNPPPCPGTDPGYRTKERDPEDVSVKKANYGAYCSKGSGTTYRGADYAPRAEGLPPYPADRNAPINRQASLFGGLTGTDGFQTVVADYDPESGHAITSTGEQYQLSSTEGAAALFGDASWEWLLMNPLRNS